jgi:hypothetical protein
MPEAVAYPMMSPAEALWNQRGVLKASRRRIESLIAAANGPNEMDPRQWAQLMAVTLDFEPDLVIELGRGKGNSTCIFTEAINTLGAEGRQIVSICRTGAWQRDTLPRLKAVVTQEWFARLRIVRGDILTFDYDAVLSDKKRVLLFWDAHGFEIAECVLGKIMPLLVDKVHLVVMHDLSDARYLPPSDADYKGQRLWKGNNWSGPRLLLGHINTAVEQAVSVVDFTSRNKIGLQSADHSLQTAFANDQERFSTLRSDLGDDLFSLRADWFWFTLNGTKGPFTFPKYEIPSAIKRSRLWRLADYRYLASWLRHRLMKR